MLHLCSQQCCSMQHFNASVLRLKDRLGSNDSSNLNSKLLQSCPSLLDSDWSPAGCHSQGALHPHCSVGKGTWKARGNRAVQGLGLLYLQ